MALLDAGQLYVGNVGDSRAVFGNSGGQAVPMSYDHKPCQLKEKKRIQEAGGYVVMNGVWRVMGVLATSRALGDYPLKVNRFFTLLFREAFQSKNRGNLGKGPKRGWDFFELIILYVFGSS